MPYKLSQRHQQNRFKYESHHSDSVDLGKIATVFIVFGFLSLLTSLIYSFETETVFDRSVNTNNQYAPPEIGPIYVSKYRESYNIEVKANLNSQSWFYIQGEVLDIYRNYLFSFGQELSKYSGYDSDGSWQEKVDNYSINITFPKPGAYYLKFDTSSNESPGVFKLKVNKKIGSSLPHLYFGILLIIIGIIVYERKNRTFSGLFDEKIDS